MNELAMEIRDVRRDAREIVGRVAPYNETSYLTGDPRGERLRRGCFARSIEQRGARIPLCIGHNHGRAAVGLSRGDGWSDGADGLTAVFSLRADELGQAALDDAANGYLPALSVAFEPIPARTRRGADGAREIHEAILKEVSLVVVGAYDGAQVLAVRSAQSLEAMLAPFQNPPPVNLTPFTPPWL